MFSFNRKLFIGIDFLLACAIFFIIFHLRYSSGLFPDIQPKQLSWHHISMFLLYAATITTLNVAMKIYELNRLTTIKESLLNCYLASLGNALFFALIFYSSKADFARFVFFMGMFLIPPVTALVNKLVFRLLFPKSRIITIAYIGTDQHYTMLTQLTGLYRASINITAVHHETTDIAALQTSITNGLAIIVDNDCALPPQITEMLHSYELQGGMIYSLLDLFEYLDESMPAELITTTHFHLFSSYHINRFYQRFIKRIGDIGIALLLIGITAPLLFITICLIKLTSKGPVFYSQKRSGYRGQEFSMYKFRTMRTDAEKDKPRLTTKNDPRITAIGRIIRPLRIDELPQLFNILKGEMSFIGPRPERKTFIDDIIKLYPLFKKRLLVKPGLTGWAQVKFQYVSSLEEMNKKLSYDLYYINHQSFMFDIKILLYTIETILFKRGAL